MTKGLPGSGKSTWARKFLNENGGSDKWVIVCKDDLREMLYAGYKHTKHSERLIIQARNAILVEAFTLGRNVIIADTGFNPIHENSLRTFCTANNAEFEIKDFTDVPVEECIKRDLQRPKSVGKDVIMKMYDQYVRPAPPVVTFDPKKPNAVIFDIDGTLALMTSGRGPYDRDRVGEDSVNKPIKTVFDLWRSLGGVRMIIVSGRDSVCREATSNWLLDNGIIYDDLYMRPEGDLRKDCIVKQEIYERLIEGDYNVLQVYDDRNQVVDMWRSLGLTCLQVAPGNF